MWAAQVAAEMPEQAHTRQRRMPQRAMPGMRTVQVAAETPEQAHIWQRRMPQRAIRDGWKVHVAANSPKTAHTWQRRTSAMSPVRYCGGTPHRAVQNQVFCRTGRPRRAVRYRKRPCGVREVHLSAGAARGGGCRAGRRAERAVGASGSWWRIVLAPLRWKSMMARWLQSRTTQSLIRAVADKYLIMSEIMICPVWFC